LPLCIVFCRFLNHTKSNRQATLLLTLSNTLRLLSPMWTDHMTQLRTSPKKRETWRLWVILDDMWTVYKGDTEDHVELLVRDIKVVLWLTDLLHLYVIRIC
jgi:hypothetical protein